MDSLSAALEQCTLVALDTQFFIYMLEESERYLQLCRTVFSRYGDPADPLEAVTSALTLTEVLVPAFRAEDGRLGDAHRRHLAEQEGLTVVAVDADIAIEAARLRARYRLETPDAIHLATAVREGCDLFITNDDHFRACPQTVMRIAFLHDYV